MTRIDRVRPDVPSAVAVLTLLTSLLVSWPATLSAQEPPAPWDAAQPDAGLRDWSDEVPAHVSVAEGEAWLDREGTVESEPTGVPLLAGDWVRTRQGRLEVMFADGSTLSLDEQTDAELLSDNLLRLNRGRIRLDLARSAGAAGYRVDAAGTTTWLRAAGEYRIDVDTPRAASSSADVRLLVVNGLAELSANGGSTLVRTGYEAFGSAQTRPSLAYAVTVTRWDTFDRWWDERRNARAGISGAQYLPTEIAYYSGVLDRDGEWAYEPNAGYVWYPRVAANWQPYSTGRWSYVGTYGWVWIGSDRWAWPTHHYGRWGYSGRRYYWIPGRSWAPAWVAWATSPAYVGWAPLGFNNRALVSIQIGYSSGWRGWTHAPTRFFGARVVRANRGQYLPPRGTPFSDHYRAPGRPSSLVVRNAPGLRGPGAPRGTTAVPRASAIAGPQTVSRPAAFDSRAGDSRGPVQRPTTSDDSRRQGADAPRRQPLMGPSSGLDRSAGGQRAVASPRIQERTAPAAGLPARTAPVMRTRDNSGVERAAPSRIQRTPVTPGAPMPSRAPTMRSRVPTSAPSPGRVAQPRQGRPDAAPAPASRTGPSPVVRAPAAAPSRQRPAGMRAPQAPPAQRTGPAARQPASRVEASRPQAPAASGRARAVPRSRD